MSFRVAFIGAESIEFTRGLEEQWLPQYNNAITTAKERRKAGNLLPTKDGFRGSVRLPVKTDK